MPLGKLPIGHSVFKTCVKTSNFSVIKIDCVYSTIWGLALSCNSTQFLHLIFLLNDFWCLCATLWECRHIKQLLLLCLLGVHSTITSPAMSKKSVNITFPVDVFDPVFIVWQIFVHPWQWRLLTGYYVIMAPWFIDCNYVIEKCVFFSKASEIIFASGSMLFGS